MKAFVTAQSGDNTIELVDVPVPHIDDDELLVRVEAIGVGIHDSYFLPSDAQYPYPIGIEGAGVIEAVGSRVSGHRIGDCIAFVNPMQVKGGTWAEYAAVKADAQIVAIPDEMSFVEAAAVPVAGGTILRTMHGLPDISHGNTLFIAGGSGAIGTFTIQLAIQQGWRVTASASQANHEFMRTLGAELAVDYRDPNWPEHVLRWIPDGVDAAIGIQPGTASDSLAVLRKGGKVIAVSGDAVASDPDSPVEMLPHDVDVRTELAQMFKRIAADDLHLEIEHVYAFEDAPVALAKAQTRRARGKLVIQPD